MKVLLDIKENNLDKFIDFVKNYNVNFDLVGEESLNKDAKEGVIE